jgi:hypothetical protein
MEEIVGISSQSESMRRTEEWMGVKRKGERSDDVMSIE